MLFCPGAGNGLWGTLQSVCVEREIILSVALYFFSLSGLRSCRLRGRRAGRALLGSAGLALFAQTGAASIQIRGANGSCAVQTRRLERVPWKRHCWLACPSWLQLAQLSQT